MKVVHLLLLAVLATLAWTNPLDDPDTNPEVSYVRIKIIQILYCAVLQVNSYFEEFMTDQSHGTDDDATAQISYSPTEIMAQSICTAITNNYRWTYAVQRKCHTSSGTCAQICTSVKLRNQDPTTRTKTWFASAALHIYPNRPSSRPGTVAAPHLGLKVFRYTDVHQSGCGPNFCCCHVL